MKETKKRPGLDITKKGWESKFKKGWKGGVRDFVFEDFLKRYKKRLGPRILDIGSGDGRHVLLLAKAGFDVTGLELTEAGNTVANAKLQNKKLKATLILGDAHSLPFIDKYFDSTISIQVFQFNNWVGAEKCFSETSRVLKKNGIFFLRVKSTLAKVPAGNRLLKNDHGATYKTDDGNIAHFYTEKEIISLGKKNNFKIIEEPYTVNSGESIGQWNVVFKKIK